MNALTNFTTPFATALRVLNREGQPWFIAKDVCETLGLTNVTRATAGLGPHEKGLQTVKTLGGPQMLTVVHESGFYKLVLKSRKPEARKFQDWVTGVVLPAIRKDGGYILGEEKVATSGRCMLPLAQCVSRLGRWTFSSESPRG